MIRQHVFLIPDKTNRAMPLKFDMDTRNQHDLKDFNAVTFHAFPNHQKIVSTVC